MTLPTIMLAMMFMASLFMGRILLTNTFFYVEGKGTFQGKAIFSLIWGVILFWVLLIEPNIRMLIYIVMVIISLEMYQAIWKKLNLENGINHFVIEFLFVGLIFSATLLSLERASTLPVMILLEVALIAISTDTVANLVGPKLRELPEKWQPLRLPYWECISTNRKKSGMAGILGAVFASTSYIVCKKLFSFLHFDFVEVFIMAFLAIIGDAVFSYCKRVLGIKDFMPILGPIGGLCDRIDSWVFLFPVAGIFLQ